MMLLILRIFIGTDEPVKCPAGSFRNSSLGMSITDCLPCTAGMYCNNTGLVLPAGLCKAGYYCPINSSTSTQYKCTVGHYCPEGTDLPKECPIGTASNTTGLESDSQCQPCEKGFYCSSTGLVQPTGPCAPGYFCPPGSNNSRSVICPSAMHCPAGSSAPKLCPEGYYTSWQQAEICSPCLGGFYCISDNVIPGVLFEVFLLLFFLTYYFFLDISFLFQIIKITKI